MIRPLAPLSFPLSLLLSLSIAAAQDGGETAPASAIPEGRGDLTFHIGETALEVFTYRPEDWGGERILMVMHGTLRNADEYRDHSIPMGDRFDALIVAPKFDRERFPSRLYQRGGILRADRSAAPSSEWTYAFVPKIVDRVRELTDRPEAKLFVIGHSAGGQFVVRMSAFQDTGATALVAANPGSVLLPTREMPFAYGFGHLPEGLADDARLRHYLAAPLTIYCGTADNAPDEYFDGSESASVQGGGRLQRGLALYWSGRTLAAERGWKFGWRFVEAPGVGHDHAKMFDHERCAVALFGEAAAPSDRR